MEQKTLLNPKTLGTLRGNKVLFPRGDQVMCESLLGSSDCSYMSRHVFSSNRKTYLDYEPV